MTLKPLFFLTLFFALAFSSCNKGVPAGFWKNFQSKYLNKNISDQGPYGGHRAIHWKADQTNVFNANIILEFANENGWTLIDSSDSYQNQTDKWVYDKKPIFPLSHTGLSDTANNVSTYEYFPRWFGGHIKIYKFKSGWVAIEPGTDISQEENGFIILNSDNSEMAMYHLWGE